MDSLICSLGLKFLNEEYLEVRSHDSAVKLHEAISANIPTLLLLLESSNRKVQVTAAHTLSTLADHGKCFAGSLT